MIRVLKTYGMERRTIVSQGRCESGPRSNFMKSPTLASRRPRNAIFRLFYAMCLSEILSSTRVLIPERQTVWKTAVTVPSVYPHVFFDVLRLMRQRNGMCRSESSLSNCKSDCYLNLTYPDIIPASSTTKLSFLVHFKVWSYLINIKLYFLFIYSTHAHENDWRTSKNIFARDTKNFFLYLSEYLTRLSLSNGTHQHDTQNIFIPNHWRHSCISLQQWEFNFNRMTDKLIKNLYMLPHCHA